MKAALAAVVGPRTMVGHGARHEVGRVPVALVALASRTDDAVLVALTDGAVVFLSLTDDAVF